MEKKFGSGISINLIIYLLIIIITVGLLSFYVKLWIGLTIHLFIIVILIHTFSSTYYTIRGDRLKIKCGVFVNKVIYIKKITRISTTYSLFSSPALSFNRLEVIYNKSKRIIISPKNQKKFIDEILLLNKGMDISFRKPGNT